MHICAYCEVFLVRSAMVLTVPLPSSQLKSFDCPQPALCWHGGAVVNKVNGKNIGMV